MDLLARRYASPFVLLEEMLSQGRLYEFVCEINTLKNEEELWEIWLHRVMDKTFDDWKQSLRMHVESRTNFDAESTVKNSFNLLSGFDPEKGR